MCKDAGPIKHFLQPCYRFPSQRCAGHSLAEGDTKPPVAFRKDKTQVTDVGTIVL